MVKEKSDTSMFFSQYCWIAEVVDIFLEYKQSGLKCVVISRAGLFVPPDLALLYGQEHFLPEPGLSSWTMPEPQQIQGMTKKKRGFCYLVRGQVRTNLLNNYRMFRIVVVYTHHYPGTIITKAPKCPSLGRQLSDRPSHRRCRGRGLLGHLS